MCSTVTAPLFCPAHLTPRPEGPRTTRESTFLSRERVPGLPGTACCPPAKAALRACPAPALPWRDPLTLQWRRVRAQMSPLTFHKHQPSPAEPGTRGLVLRKGLPELGPGAQGCSDPAGPHPRPRRGLPRDSQRSTHSPWNWRFPRTGPQACTGTHPALHSLAPTGKCSSEFTRSRRRAARAASGRRVARHCSLRL